MNFRSENVTLFWLLFGIHMIMWPSIQ